MPTFTLQESFGRKSTEIELNKDVIIIGRDYDCDIVLNSRDVSRRHARVVRCGDRTVIEDLQSANGTFVNSGPIEAPCELKHLDRIQIAGSVFVYNDPDNLADNGFRDGQANPHTFEFMHGVVAKLENNIGRVFKGKPEIIRNVLIALLADGHVLLEDTPGVGKSILAQALSKSIQGTYKRIQFTPDLLPSDILGMNIYDENTKEFRFIPGPIFGNIILADEINRTTPRTQSSLLEAMSESVVTIDGAPRVLPKPFFVIATQNPDDYHGTYPLPEPQLDRFLMRLSIGFPTAAAELEILTSQVCGHPLKDISYVVKAIDIVQCQALVRRVHVAPAIMDYIVKIAAATRNHPALGNGCSPRASLALMHVAQALAAYNRREYVTPRDVRDMVLPVLGHRITLKLRYHGEWGGAGDVLEEILGRIPAADEDPQR
ncbi:MAG: AAA family ATPase [Victivallales bacterium]|nr:AAA family ATPase [Victivallales bacterium]